MTRDEIVEEIRVRRVGFTRAVQMAMEKRFWRRMRRGRDLFRHSPRHEYVWRGEQRVDLGAVVKNEHSWRNFSNVCPLGRDEETKVAVEFAKADSVTRWIGQLPKNDFGDETEYRVYDTLKEAFDDMIERLNTVEILDESFTHEQVDAGIDAMSGPMPDERDSIEPHDPSRVVNSDGSHS